jgi:hypothetical protein
VSFLKAPLGFCCGPLILHAEICIYAGSCLNPVDEDRRVSERIAALERASTDTNTFWTDPHRCSAIVLLQDRTQHIGEAIVGCRKSLTTMYSVVLPRNSWLENFGQLLDISRTSQHVYRLIELNLVAGVLILPLDEYESGTQGLIIVPCL